MSKDYTFRSDLSVTIGNPTKKSDYDKLVENTKELDQRLEAVMLLGTLFPLAGEETIGYDTSNRVSGITYTTSPVGNVAVTYDDENGGRVDNIEVHLTDPVIIDARLEYGYTTGGNLSTVNRVIL